MAVFASSSMRTKPLIDALGTVAYSGMPTHNGSAGAATLSDSSRVFVSGAFVGGTLYNVTDGSSGTITANDATTITATLSGGADNTWGVGDTYLICHPENGVFFSSTMQIQITGLVGASAITSAFYCGIEVEQGAISADAGDYPSEVLQSMSAQAARNVASIRLIYLEKSGGSDRRIIELRPNSNTVYAIVAITDGVTVSDTALINSNATERQFQSATGAKFAKIALSCGQTSTKFYVNRVNTISLTTAGAFDSTITDTLRIGQSGTSVGDYWIRNIEFSDSVYVPHIDGNATKKGVVRLAGLGDSFTLKGFESVSPINNITRHGYRIQQEMLKNGYECVVLNHGINGHGWGATVRIDADDVAAMLADYPTDVLIHPSVNDLSDSGYALGITLDDYKTRLRATIELIAAGSTVRRIWTMTQPPFLNCAESAGFGGTSAVAEFHYLNPSYVAAINAFWVQLKTDPGLSAIAKAKLQQIIQIDIALGADADGKGYSREHTLGSATSAVSASEVHQTPLAMISYAAVISPVMMHGISHRQSSGLIRPLITRSLISR